MRSILAGCLLLSSLHAETPPNHPRPAAAATSNSAKGQPEGPSALTSRAVAQQLLHEPTDARIRAYERLLESDRGSATNQLGLISAYLQKVRESGDFSYLDRASRLVDTMLEKEGGNFAALRYQNEIDLQRHEFKTVVDRAESMIKDNPSDPGTWANLGDASMELGEYDRAGKAYLRMFSLRPNLGSYNRLAFWRFVTGDGETAIYLMQQAVQAGDQIPENTAWCMAELGDMYFKLGKVQEAAKVYSGAIGLFPRLHRALAGLAKTEAISGHLEGAIREYRQAQAIVPLVEYAFALEDLYTASGLPKKAAEQRELIETIQVLGKVNNEKTNRNLALALADHERRLDVAMSLMTAELPVRGDVYTWDAMSWVLFKSGRLEEARAASAKALKLHTPEPVFYYHASQIAAASGDEAASREYSSRLESLNPKFDFSKKPLARASAQ